MLVDDLSHGVHDPKVLIAPTVILAQMTLGSMVTQKFFWTSAIDRNVALTNLAVKCVTIPFGIHWSRNKGACPKHAFEVFFTHNFAGSSNASVRGLRFRFGGLLWLLLGFISLSFVLQLSQSLGTRPLTWLVWDLGPKVNLTAIHRWRSDRLH